MRVGSRDSKAAEILVVRAIWSRNYFISPIHGSLRKENLDTYSTAANKNSSGFFLANSSRK